MQAVVPELLHNSLPATLIVFTDELKRRCRIKAS
jgi:hypothetical protein